MERLKRFWYAFKNIAILFSFTVNLILVLVLVLAVRPLFMLKSGLVEPLLHNLDAAFLGLSETTIGTTVEIDQQLPIEFDLPLDQQLPVDFNLPIEQPTVVRLTQSVPLSGLPATFVLPAGGGVINGSVSLALPAGMQLPIALNMVVPVSQTIPVQLTVPVSQTIPVQMTVPVHILLGEAGMDPAVEELRAVFRPVTDYIESLADGVEFPSWR